jgi:Domain of unknown function (DUF4389)
VLLLVFGILISMIGGALLTAGLTANGVNQLRDEDGYFTTPVETFTTETFALTSPTADRLTVEPDVRTIPFDLATVRLRAESANGDVFVGIARMADIDRYLGDVQRTEIRSVRYLPFEVEYRDLTGSSVPQRPARQDFWAASASGPGIQQVEWSIAPGEWGVVVMNADASDSVTVRLQAGVRSDLIAPIASVLIVTGILLLLIGIPMLVVGAVLLGRATSGGHPTEPPSAPGGAGPARVPSSGAQTAAPLAGVAPDASSAVVDQSGQPPGRGTAFPAALTGLRGEPVSRWLWLVKWLLAIPHYVILAFLWFAFLITTIIAGFAVLFTGRYPRSLFAFNVGVLRWTWRVGFYSYSALGTDRYPPFTLARTDYPADFDVPYPEHLSRGLVLVKWWLLAIPHYLILSAISGPLIVWQQTGWDGDRTRTGFSLVAVLVLIVGISLLFTARYPGGLFDLLLGIQRWTFRVITYAALLRDEYPPFRLDQGPREPDRRAPEPVSAPDSLVPA